jgi:2-polyprenyl-3-methyl-5-hydroxy-6-metoxy-1,4-benzoquinol methylase
MRVCGACRIAWLVLPPSKSDFARIYQDYFTHFPEEPAPVSHHFRAKVKAVALARLWGQVPEDTPRMVRAAAALALFIPRYRELLKAATQWLARNETGRLLDVGCGSGIFLKRMRDLGWDVQGIDPDRHAVEQARERFGLEVQAARFEEHRFPADFFDAVVASHVIEHVHDPVSFLRECRRILKPGGKLVILTPNYFGLQRRWLGRTWRGFDCPRHLFLFSRRSLRRSCEMAGLQVVTLRTTARGAKDFWLISRMKIADPQRNAKRKPPGLRAEAFFYDCLERSLLHFWPDAGAEILLVAGK